MHGAAGKETVSDEQAAIAIPIMGDFHLMTQPPYSPAPYVAVPTPKRGMPGWGWALMAGCAVVLFFFVAIFAAILFPVFAKAREKARQSSCASNLKQISLQMLGYSQDNDDKFPPASHWMDSLKPYSSRSQMEKGDTFYHCPSLRGQNPGDYGYAYNSNVAAKPVSKIVDAETKMLMYDSSTLTRSASDPGTSRPAKGRHSTGSNVAFTDGHVKWFRVGDDKGTYGDGRPVMTP